MAGRRNWGIGGGGGGWAVTGASVVAFEQAEARNA